MRYAIDREGIEHLQQLKKDLQENMERINDAVHVLLGKVDSCEKDLGEYYDNIRGMIEQTKKIQGQGGEAVNNLTETIIPRQIKKIEELILLYKR